MPPIWHTPSECSYCPEELPFSKLRLRTMVVSHTTLQYERVLRRSVICGIPVEGGYYGACMGDRVVVDNRLAPAREFKVLTHEFAHFLLGHVTGTRLSYADDWEAEAKGVACLLCEAVGLRNAVETATSYLLPWHGSLKQTYMELTDGGQQDAAGHD